MGDWRDKPCKEWVGAKTSDGYGQQRVNGVALYIHRIAWEEANGPIPENMRILHHCDNPPCYEITHLFLGTAKNNSEDMVEKGRANNQNRFKAACVHGHPFSPDNTYIDIRGGRHCRECHRLREARIRKAKRERTPGSTSDTRTLENLSDA